MTDNKSTQDTKATDEPQDFAVLLTGLDKGRPIKDLSAAMQDVVQAVTETGKPGKVQLTITVKQQKGVDGSAVLVAADVRKTAPKFDPKTTLYFADEDGALSRTNPDQPNLF